MTPLRGVMERLWHLGEEGLSSWTSEHTEDASRSYIDVLGRENQRRYPTVNGSDSSSDQGI